MNEYLTSIRNLIDKPPLTPRKNKIHALVIFDPHCILRVTGKAGLALSLTLKSTCIWFDDYYVGEESLLNASLNAEDSPGGTRRRSSTSSAPAEVIEDCIVNEEWPVPLAKWLHKKLNANVQKYIGIDLQSIPHSIYKTLSQQLDQLGEHRIVDISQTLERVCPSPKSPNDYFPVTKYDIYAKKVRERIFRCWPSFDTKWMVITSTDEIAWLFDLQNPDIRGGISAVILGPRPKLFIEQDPDIRIRNALKKEIPGFEVRPTCETLSALNDLRDSVTLSNNVSECIFKALQNVKCKILDLSPVTVVMGQRNIEEQTIIFDLFERDSAVVCYTMNKCSVELLSAERGRYDDFICDASMITTHGRAKLLRTRARYRQGVCYTARMIKGVYDQQLYTLSVRAFLLLINTRFPDGKCTGVQLDAIVARQIYWNAGLDIQPETGRALGLQAVLDSPSLGANCTRVLEIGNVFKFQAVESGAENCVMVVGADEIPSTTTLPEFDSSIKWLQCRPLTFVPFEPATLNMNLLNADDIKYLNEYNSLCYELIQERIESFGNGSCPWLKSASRPIE